MSRSRMASVRSSTRFLKVSEATSSITAESTITPQSTKVMSPIESGSSSYHVSVYYMDIINQYERMGDFMINVSQDLEKVFAHKG